jgi:hypothetical protein
MTDDSTNNRAEQLASHIQYGDTNQIIEAIGQLTDARLAQHAEQEELKRGHKFLDGFKANNKDILDDPEASAAAERHVYAIMQEDLAKHGITLDSMKAQLGRDPTANDLAGLHLKFRTHQPGKVRTIDQAISEAADRFRDQRDNTTGHRTAVTKAIAQRVDATRKLRGEVPLGEDFVSSSEQPPARPVQDPEIAKRSNAVAAMKNARQTARASSFRDFIGGGRGRRGAA